MLSTIVNGFKSVIGFFETLISFIASIVHAGVKLLASIPDIISSLSAAIGILPTVLVAAALFVISVRVAVLVINKKAGE